ncbi:MAG: PhnB protein [Actinomycetota bacterium]|nr:PhnB protein [Actinomycetota bacterium]
MGTDAEMGRPEAFGTSIAPWLPVDDAQKAVEFYKAAFGAVELYRLDSEGGLEVAQLSVGGAVFWVQDDIDAGSESRGTASIRMILSVADPDAVFASGRCRGCRGFSCGRSSRLANGTHHRSVRLRLGDQQTAHLTTASPAPAWNGARAALLRRRSVSHTHPPGVPRATAGGGRDHLRRSHPHLLRLRRLSPTPSGA